MKNLHNKSPNLGSKHHNVTAGYPYHWQQGVHRGKLEDTTVNVQTLLIHEQFTQQEPPFWLETS